MVFFIFNIPTMPAIVSRPAADSYPAYFASYIILVSGDDALSALSQGLGIAIAYYAQISAERHDYQYAPGKWTPKEVMIHLIDCERVFCYRALAIARGDTASLASFDQNAYVANANAASRHMDGLLEEYKAVRAATLSLFKGMNLTMLNTVGTVNQRPIGVSAIAYILAGHELHHLSQLQIRLS